MTTPTNPQQIKEERRKQLDDIHNQYMAGDLCIDPDDPRTTIGLTKEEVAAIIGERAL